MINKLDFLPDFIKIELLKLNLKQITELRIRCGKRLFYKQLRNRLFLQLNQEITPREIEKMVLKITQHSIYAYAESIKEGYLSHKGLKIGLCGECVKENGSNKIIKNITSLVIRIPHEIEGCATKIYQQIYSKNLASILVISPPSFGKTTIIRDLACQIAENKNLNVLIVDERGEIAINNQSFHNCDVLSYATKAFALHSAIRTLSPDVIIVDEIITQEDANSCVFSVLSGVKVIATAHAESLFSLKKKENFKVIFENKIFDYAITLTSLGQYEITKIYDN